MHPEQRAALQRHPGSALTTARLLPAVSEPEGWEALPSLVAEVAAEEAALPGAGPPAAGAGAAGVASIPAMEVEGELAQPDAPAARRQQQQERAVKKPMERAEVRRGLQLKCCCCCCCCSWGLHWWRL